MKRIIEVYTTRKLNRVKNDYLKYGYKLISEIKGVCAILTNDEKTENIFIKLCV